MMDFDAVEPLDEEATQLASPQRPAKVDHVAFQISSPVREIQETPAKRSPEPTTTVDTMGDELDTQYFTANHANNASSNNIPHHHESTTPAGSPIQDPLTESPKKTSPVERSPTPAEQPTSQAEIQSDAMDADVDADVDADAARDEPSGSPSDGSSPIRPIVRKSSLNFASLPAREPMTHKSIGNRISRTSHLDQRTSYYNRHTGGKSLGNVRPETSSDDHDVEDDMDDMDDMDIDDEVDVVSQKPKEQAEATSATTHNKTYTQRLQDQISKLGQSQPSAARTSKSIANVAAATQQTAIPVPATIPAPQSPPKALASSPKTQMTPGAFPEEDDEDDWIRPLGPPDDASNFFSPRPAMPKSHSTDVMEGVSGKETVGGGDFVFPKTRDANESSKSPYRPPALERIASTLGHHKSASVPTLPTQDHVEGEELSLKKTFSVSNPPLATVSENEAASSSDSARSPPRSPTRSLRDSPLKQVKNKLSSILKTSKGLLASSAALSAEGKSSLMSPSITRLGLHAEPSNISLDQQSTQDPQPLYPDLSQRAAESQSQTSVVSPVRTEGRRTRASIEREKAEEKRKEKEAKEAKRVADQMEKLEKAREKEREKARVFSQEQERVAAMEKQMASQKEQDKKATATTPAPARETRISPRKGKAQAEAEAKTNDDVDMAEATNTIPPPSVSRPPPSAAKGREIKRPTKPVKETAGKAKQAPTVIRVNMGSQHSQYHPSNSTLASNLGDTLGSAIKPKASQVSLHMKQSQQSLKSSQSSSSRPKALEMAARRKEQEEREAQRKREAKAEIERKRAALQEEERRQEQQRKLEAEKQKEEERKQAAARDEAKKNAQRQAMLEKAKQTRAPPPAARSVNGQPDYRGAMQGESQSSRPPARLTSTAPKHAEDFGRSVGSGLANGSKSTTKRTLQHDPKDSKRMRMTADDFDDELDMDSQPSLKGAPVRPSGGFKKVTAGTLLSQSQKSTKAPETQNKSMFPAGYTNAPPSTTRDLFKSTLTSQHNAQSKVGHPLDMAQVSKSAIPFAPNPAGPAHKTPARPGMAAGAKSAVKSTVKSAAKTRTSPRFQNGEQIELPEINTDDEDDEDDDDHRQMFASWTDSPALRRALMEQETLDPMQVFGAPAPLNMEEVFSSRQERWQKFRQRTSSANWSGADRLTEDDIRKDLAARDKLRREGGWSYELSKDVL
jgi:hypothetical protein